MCYREPDTCNTLIRDNDLKEGHAVAGTSGSSATSCLGGGETWTHQRKRPYFLCLVDQPNWKVICRRQEANKASVLDLCVRGTMNTVTFYWRNIAIPVFISQLT